MGVKGLWWYLKNNFTNDDSMFMPFDLVQEAARSEDGLTLVVDFYPFEYWMMEKVGRDANYREKSVLNPWLTISGGEYSFFSDYVIKFVKALSNCGIKLVIVTNAGRCSSTGQTDLKYARWLQTDIKDMNKVADLLEFVEDNEPLDGESGEGDAGSNLKGLETRELRAPTLLQVELVERLVQAGCEVLCSLDGEADHYIAQLRFERRAFAILSNDSDLLLFENCRYINLDEHFDTNGALADFLQSDGDEDSLNELQVYCVNSQDVYLSLGLENIDAACDLAFVLGNDVSKQFPDLYKRLNLYRFGVQAIAQRLRKGGPISKNPAFASDLADPRIKEAYRLTHELYKMELNFEDEDEAPFDDSGVELAKSTIWDAIVKCRIAGHCLPMSRGFYWHDAKIIESYVNKDSSLYSSEAACLPVRLVLYKMLMTNTSEKQQMIEYRPTPSTMETEKVTYSMSEMVERHPWLADIPKFCEIADMSRSARLDLFDRIIAKCFTTGADFEKTDTASDEKIYEQFGEWPDAFRVYVCRFIWLANGGDKNMKMTRPEMESVIATVFAAASRMDYVDLGLEAACKPTRRSLTVGSFVQVAYRYLYYYLAKLLNLADVHDSGLPLPSSFFSGSLFTAMFACIEQKTDDNCISHNVKNKAPFEQVRRVREQILEKHAAIVESVFSPKD